MRNSRYSKICFWSTGVLAASAGALIIGCGGSGGGSGSSTSGGEGPPLTHANIGINTYARWDQFTEPDTSSFDGTLAVDKRIGFTSVRVPMHWDDVDPAANGTYNFGPYENAVKSIVKVGLQPVVVALTTHASLPSTQWGAGSLGFPITQSDMNLYSSFIAAAAQDLGGIAPSNLVIEIGNEPNLLSSDITKADDYAALFKLCRTKTSQAIQLAGPAVTTFQDGSSSTVSSTTYAQRCKDDLMLPDIFTAHLYNGVNAPSNLATSEQQLASIAGNAPFWITECGYATGPAGNVNAVSADTQSSYLLYEVKNFPTLGAAKVFLYDDRDTEGWCAGTGNASCVEPSQTMAPQEGFFGVMDHSRILKPSGQALRTYLHTPLSSAGKVRR